MPTVMLVSPTDRSNRSVSAGSRSVRVSMENWIFRGKRPISSAKANTCGRCKPNSGSRNLNERKPQRPMPCRISSPTASGLRRRVRIVQHDVGTIVALHRAAAAGLDQRRGKPPKVVADAKLLRAERRPVGQRQPVEVLQRAQLHGRPRPGQHFVELPQQLLGLALDHGHAQVGEELRQHGGRRTHHQHPRRRIAPQQAGHHVVLQRERQQRRIEDVQIGAGGKPVLGIFDAVSEPGEDRRQVGKHQRHRPAVAGVETPNQPAAEAAVAGILADAETAGEILRDVVLSRVPEYDVHGREGFGDLGIWGFRILRPHARRLRPAGTV